MFLCSLAEEGDDVTHAVLAAIRALGLDTRDLVSNTASIGAVSIVLQDYHYQHFMFSGGRYHWL